MATRLIGTDDADPRLPEVVVQATLFSPVDAGMVPPSGDAAAANFLRADGTWQSVASSGGALDQATADPLYVNVDGDAMTGTLSLESPARIELTESDATVGSLGSVAGQVQLFAAGDAGVVIGGMDSVQLTVSPGGVLLFRDPTAPLEAATKAYVDAIAIAAGGGISQGDADIRYVQLAGSTMTGLLILSADPTDPLGAVTKQYVDNVSAALDPLYVNVAGDTMTGPLTIEAAVHCLSLRRTGGAPFLQFDDVLGTPRYGYIQMSSTAGTYACEIAAGYHRFLVGLPAAEKFRVDATGAITTGRHNITGVLTTAGITSTAGVNVTGQVKIDGGAAGLILTNEGNGPYVAFYPGDSVSSLGTRKGYCGFTSANLLAIYNEAATPTMRLNCVAANGNIQFYVVNAHRMAIDLSGTVLIGKTASDQATGGCEIRAAGTVIANAASNTTNHIENRSGSGVVSGGIYHSFRKTGTSIGSIVMGSNLTSVNYNTTSHAPWKGEVETLDAEAALARVQSIRPVSFRWLLDADGNPTQLGAPTGEVQHGFIAQELADVVPGAVTIGSGEESEHDTWLVRSKAAASEAATRAAEWDPLGDEALPPVPDDDDPVTPWMVDQSRLIPDLVAAVQALTARVLELEGAA